MPTNPVARRVAEKVRAEVRRKGLTQCYLAQQLGTSQPFISRRLSGRVPFDVDDLAKIAELLDIPITELIAA